MAARVRDLRWLRLLILLLLLTPGMLLLAAGGSPLWFWFTVLLSTLLIWLLLGSAPDDEFGASPAVAAPVPIPEPPPDFIERSMNVKEAVEIDGVRVFRGYLRESAAAVYARLKSAFSDRIVPMIQPERNGGAAIVLVPRPVEQAAMEKKVRPWVHWLLFFLTFVTTTFAGAAHQRVNLLREPEQFAVGLPYALALLGILGLHELGHYFTARYHGMQVTPPYFIPVPFALGTFGAFIQMRSPAEGRRPLFDVAVAGPLAGLLVAIPALYFGLRGSEILPASPEMARGMAGPLSQVSILLSLLMKASLGDALVSGEALRLSPMAFAGWLGLLITALNLLPIGQLDGGHMARAMFGTRAGMVVSWSSMTALFLLALFVWPSLMTWAIIVFFLAGRPMPPLNDITPLTPGRRLIGLAAFLLLLAILLPAPQALLGGMDYV
ncbi:MAG: site-2 protease family protein [Acidobacteria bacterium]|nr:site-2 protease family protein [Acidobacteriota bacterium]